jgi:hypothetical protein
LGEEKQTDWWERDVAKQHARCIDIWMINVCILEGSKVLGIFRPDFGVPDES